MGFPIKEDSTLDYDSPAPSPTRLTDGAAEYVAPSAAAMEFVLSRLEVKGGELDGVPFWYTEINGTCLTVRTMKAPCDLAWRVLRQKVTALCEEYAAQQVAAAVEAERERVVEVFAKAASDTNRGLYEPDKRPPAPHDAIILALHLAYKRLGVRGLKKDETATHF